MTLRTSMSFKLHLPIHRSNHRRYQSEPPAALSSTSTVAVVAGSAQSSFSLPPGDQPARFSPGYKVSPAELRDLNELIRQRYTLDIEIWGKRHCMPRDRPLVVERMIRADAALSKILGIVRAWDTPDVWESEADYLLLKNIRYRLEMVPGKRMWADNPPWLDK
jgi:hypothetical protein